MAKLNISLPPLPGRMKHLPLNYQGHPVPWFVQFIKHGKPAPWGEGEPDFRVMDRDKWHRALKHDLCWLCGGKLGRHKAFTIGPMCCVNRTTSEPPSHRDCAVFAAMACPFLTRPRMKRHVDGLPEELAAPPGIHLDRNPGAVCVWITKSFKLFKTDGGTLIELGDPSECLWFAEGKPATREQIETSIAGGLPKLRTLAEKDGLEAIAALDRQILRAASLLPPPRHAHFPT
jgi:hypothetical protein